MDEPNAAIGTDDQTADLIEAVLSIANGVAQCKRRDNAIRIRTDDGTVIEIDVWTVRRDGPSGPRTT